PSSPVTESKPGLQENQRNIRSSLCKPREGLSRSKSSETDRQVSYEEGNAAPTQARYWFPPGKESTSRKDLADIYPSTVHAQEEYKFTPNQEALASGEGDSIIEVQISAATEQSETEYLSTPMKEEPTLCNGGDLSDADVYSLPEKTRTGYPSRPVSKDLALREEGNPTGIYSPSPLVEQSHVMGQKPKTNADLYVRMFHETDGTSSPPQNTHGPERTSVFSGYNALFSIPSDSLASPGVTKLQPFPAKQQLIKHMKTHRGPKMYPCSDCGKAFNRESHLNLHLRTHTGEKPYTCPECGKSFSQKSHLRRHHSVHTGVKQYGCIECGITFMRKSDLVQHQISHAEGEAFIYKRFLCPETGKYFNGNHSNVTQQKILTAEKPFKCPDCGKCFTLPANLASHRRSHTGEKPFICPERGDCPSNGRAVGSLHAAQGEDPEPPFFYFFIMELEKAYRSRLSNSPPRC
uniref:C2H2-type domain-containing protein n=1 Tax=Leptobrachium leishanense TaxID=445787 RepID=A0A8C5MHT8_9ANUR